MLYQLKLKDSALAQVYVLLEHKRTPERSAPFQLLRYQVKIGECALNEGIDPPNLPPVIQVLVYKRVLVEPTRTLTAHDLRERVRQY